MSLRRWLVRSYIQKSRLTAALVTKHKEKYEKNESGRYYKTGITVVLGSALITASLTDKFTKKEESLNSHSNVAKSENVYEAGTKRPDLPTYSAEEVSKHNTKSNFWVTYKHGVYDVTEFLPSHPGGEQIYNAAGLSIEPFWNVYGMHKTHDVYKLLESYRIGNLHDEDVVDHSDDELWAREPRRDKRLIVRTAKPFNAEIPPEYQIKHFDTPNELFYVRQHMPVPELERSSHKLRVTVVGREVTSKQFSLDELEQFEQGSVRAALMCAGNRRSDMIKEVKDKTVKGIGWAGGAVSCAVWRGVRLRELLLACGVDDAHTEGLHVVFQGADIDATGVNFSTSIPLSMAMNPQGDILLATHMNGEPLPPDHGHPLRVVVPGAPAVRSVKWLESITVSAEESASHWHQKDYRSLNPSVTWQSARTQLPRAPPVYSLPVTCAVCRAARATAARLQAAGYAYSGGGAKILRVDVSADRGATWLEAELESDPAPPGRHYAWTLWSVSIPVTEDQQEVEIWAKATDSNFNTQPENFDHIWNIRGILSNAYHKIKVKIIH